MKSSLAEKLTKQRVNITLPMRTIQLINHITEKGERSRFIDTAVRFYLTEKARLNLKKELKIGALKRRQTNLELSDNWLNIEEERWRKIK